MPSGGIWRHPEDTQEAPRRHPEAPKRHPETPSRQPGHQRVLGGRMCQNNYVLHVDTISLGIYDRASRDARLEEASTKVAQLREALLRKGSKFGVKSHISKSSSSDKSCCTEE